MRIKIILLLVIFIFGCNGKKGNLREISEYKKMEQTKIDSSKELSIDKKYDKWSFIEVYDDAKLLINLTYNRGSCKNNKIKKR